jgi:hypothetical protein
VKDENLLWQVVSAGFAHPRKTILNNLREAPESIQELLKKRGGANIVLCDAAIQRSVARKRWLWKNGRCSRMRCFRISRLDSYLHSVFGRKDIAG